MQIIRTIVWVLALVALGAFIAFNWGTTSPVRFWPLSDGHFLQFDWPVWFIAIVFYLLGLLPMWLLHKGTKWRFNRRISALENTVRATSASAPAPVATTTQLDAAAADPHAPAP